MIRPTAYLLEGKFSDDLNAHRKGSTADFKTHERRPEHTSLDVSYYDFRRGMLWLSI
jgi:hypothetical protein